MINKKYEKIITSCGYEGAEFIPKKISNFVEFYRFQDLFIKVSSFNKHSKGLESEFEILNQISHFNFIPNPVEYKRVNSIEVLVLDYIQGVSLKREIYSKSIKQTLINQVEKLHKSGITHGDIKEDNFIINKEKICIVDFDQSYKFKTKTSFHNSDDFSGNDGRNIMNLIRRMEL